ADYAGKKEHEADQNSREDNEEDNLSDRDLSPHPGDHAGGKGRVDHHGNGAAVNYFGGLIRREIFHPRAQELAKDKRCEKLKRNLAEDRGVDVDSTGGIHQEHHQDWGGDN